MVGVGFLRGLLFCWGVGRRGGFWDRIEGRRREKGMAVQRWIPYLMKFDMRLCL
jgi:hypothetical protein